MKLLVISVAVLLAAAGALRVLFWARGSEELKEVEGKVIEVEEEVSNAVDWELEVVIEWLSALVSEAEAAEKDAALDVVKEGLASESTQNEASTRLR